MITIKPAKDLDMREVAILSNLTIKGGSMKKVLDKPADHQVFISSRDFIIWGWATANIKTGLVMVFVKMQYRGHGRGTELVSAAVKWLSVNTDIKPYSLAYDDESYRFWEHFKSFSGIDMLG